MARNFNLTAASLEVCEVYAARFGRCIRDFFLVTRSQQRLDDLSKEIISEKIDEMLALVPLVTAPHYLNTAGSSLEQLPQEVASPFGDW